MHQIMGLESISFINRDFLEAQTFNLLVFLEDQYTFNLKDKKIMIAHETFVLMMLNIKK